VAGLDRGQGGALVQDGFLDAGLGAGKLAFGSLVLPLGVQGCLHQFGAGEFEDDRVGLHRGAGVDEDLLHAGIGIGGDPPHVHGLERAGAPHLEDHGPSPHGVHQEVLPLHRRHRGLEAPQAEGDRRDGQDAAADEEGLFAARLGGAGEIHGGSGGSAGRIARAMPQR